MSVQDGNVRAGTLAEAVQTDNTHARAFINVRLGRIIRARSAQDIRKGNLAASEDGKYAHGRGIEYRRLQAIPRLGKSVREQQIAQLSQQFTTAIEQRLQPAADGERRLQAILRAFSQAAEVLFAKRADAIRIIGKIETADAERDGGKMEVFLRDRRPNGAVSLRI